LSCVLTHATHNVTASGLQNVVTSHRASPYASIMCTHLQQRWVVNG
jgi:hypothetical protein